MPEPLQAVQYPCPACGNAAEMSLFVDWMRDWVTGNCFACGWFGDTAISVAGRWHGEERLPDSRQK